MIRSHPGIGKTRGDVQLFIRLDCHLFEQLAPFLGVVFQESMLFARSIADNIRVGRPDASDDDVLAALEKAQGVQEKSTFVAHQKLPLLVA